MSASLVRAENLSATFHVRQGLWGSTSIMAVREVDLEVRQGNALGVVGEFGLRKEHARPSAPRAPASEWRARHVR